MANFSPVGVEAIVEGLDNFDRSLDAMWSSTEKLNDSVTDMANDVNQSFTDMIDAIENQTSDLVNALSMVDEETEDVGDEMAETAPKAKKLGASFVDVANMAANVTTALINVGKVIFDVAKAAVDGAIAVGKFAFQLGKGAFDAAVSFESAFAGVTKTVNTSQEELDQLSDGLRDMSKITPISVEDLAGIAELGGQLGVVDEKTKDASGTLLGFTEAIAALGVATNLTGEEGATQLAQFANIMGTTAREGDETFSKLGSTIVALGNNMATTERDISNFASRIAGAGQIAGLTEADVFAIGAAMGSVGVQAEAGGTAVQKVLLAMNESVLSGGAQLEIFAATAGTTTEEFAELWEKDAGAAFEGFVSGLGEMGDDAIGVLDALELKDQRLIRSFLSLGNAGDLLEKSMTIASEAFEENTALAKEAAQRYATTESQMEIMKNTFKDIGITVGSVLLPVFNDLLTFAKPLITEFAVLVEGLAGQFTKAFQAGSEDGDILQGVLWGVGEVLDDFLPESTMERVWDFLDGIQNLIEWLQINLPIAIQTASDFWTGTLLPAIQGAWAFIQNNVLPVLATLAEWFQGVLAIAIDHLATKWNSILLPAFQALQEQWETNIKPALADLWAWLQERVPPAIEFLANAWETILKPALELVGTFLSEVVIPILGEVVTWLLENIPPAIDAAALFFETTLVPALETVWTFIQENVIPIIEDVVTWLQENIPIAIEEARRVWEEVLLPAIEAIWAFITNDLLPLFEALDEFLQATLSKTLETLAFIWSDTIQPALETVWKYIDEKILPILNDLWSDIEETLRPALEWLEEFLVNKLTKGFTSVRDAIKEAVDWIKNLTNKVNKFDPSKMKSVTAESPAPLAVGLNQVSRAMRELSTIELPRFNQQMAGGSMAASPVSAQNVLPNNNINIQVGPNQVGNNVEQAYFEGRVTQVIEGALSL